MYKRPSSLPFNRKILFPDHPNLPPLTRDRPDMSSLYSKKAYTDMTPVIIRKRTMSRPFPPFSPSTSLVSSTSLSWYGMPFASRIPFKSSVFASTILVSSSTPLCSCLKLTRPLITSLHDPAWIRIFLMPWIPRFGRPSNPS